MESSNTLNVIDDDDEDEEDIEVVDADESEIGIKGLLLIILFAAAGLSVTDQVSGSCGFGTGVI